MLTESWLHLWCQTLQNSSYDTYNPGYYILERYKVSEQLYLPQVKQSLVSSKRNFTYELPH